MFYKIHQPMPLIIESYDHPYTQIALLLFPGREFTYIDHPITEPTSELFCYTRQENNPEQIRYCFNRIYSVENGRIVCINKAAQKIKFYDIRTGKLLAVDKTEYSSIVEVVEKAKFLPQLHAQTGEVVIFPDSQDSEDDE